MAFWKGRRWQRRRRVRMSGLILVLTTALIGAAAVNTGTNLLYMILGGALSLFALSLVLAPINLAGVRVTRSVPKAAYREQPLNVDVAVENRKFLFPALGLRVELANAPGTILGYCMKIPARRRAVISTQLVFPRRGVHPVPPVDVVSSFPFGFTDRWRRQDDGAEIVVYPRVRPVRSSALEHMRGERTMSRVPSNDGDEYHSLREYLYGDDVRKISWRASARLGKWMIREMSKDNSRFIVLALDTRRTAEDERFPELFEEAVELVASFAVMLIHKQYNVAIETPAATLDGGEGSLQERRVLEFLARVQPVTMGDYPSFEDAVTAIESRLASVVYITPNPERWGRRSGLGAPRALDPREVIYA